MDREEWLKAAVIVSVYAFAFLLLSAIAGDGFAKLALKYMAGLTIVTAFVGIVGFMLHALLAGLRRS